MNKYFDILEKYDLNDKIDKMYKNETDDVIHNDVIMTKCTTFFLNKIRKEKKDELQKKMQVLCLIKEINKNCSDHFTNRSCKNCKFYNKDLKKIIEARDELKEASDAFNKHQKDKEWKR